MAAPPRASDRPVPPLRKVLRESAELLAAPRLLALGVGAAVLQAVLLVPVGPLVAYVFDDVLPDRDRGALAVAAGVMLGLYVASAALGAMGRRLVARESKEAPARLRMRAFERLYAMPPEWLLRRDMGALHARLVGDAERVETMLSWLVIYIVPAVVVGVALSVVAAWLAPVAFVALVLAIPLVTLPGQRLDGRARRWASRYTAAAAAYSAHTMAALRILPLTKADGAERFELARRRADVTELSESATGMAEDRALYQGFSGAVATVSGVVVLIVGGLLVIDGSMSIGRLLAFYAVTALLLRQVAQVIPGIDLLITGGLAIERLQEVARLEPPPPPAGRRTPLLGGAFSLDGVTFAYPEASAPVLHGVDLEVRPGEHLALTGPNGGGKTTLVHVLCGLYVPQEGAVRADGIPYSELDLPALRRRIALALQDPLLVPGTVLENVRYGSDATASRAMDALEAVGARFVHDLPAGFETAIGDGGVPLSGGQRRQISLARALARDSVLLVLDEPTADLDARASTELFDSIREFAGRRTIVSVTHEPALMARADRCVTVRDGRLFPEPAARPA